MMMRLLPSLQLCWVHETRTETVPPVEEPSVLTCSGTFSADHIMPRTGSILPPEPRCAHGIWPLLVELNLL